MRTEIEDIWQAYVVARRSVAPRKTPPWILVSPDAMRTNIQIQV
jgi:hypothetical protein